MPTWLTVLLWVVALVVIGLGICVAILGVALSGG